MNSPFLHSIISSMLFVGLLMGCNNQGALKNQGPEAMASEEIALADASVQRVQAPEEEQANFASAPQNDKAVETPVAVPTDKKIIRSGSISIESKDIQIGKKVLDAQTKKYQGYYEQESREDNNGFVNYNLIVRIPSAQFDSFVQEIESGNDKITQKNIQSQDISLQYYDTESRLKSKQAALRRYTQLLSQAKTVKDVLEVQEQIRILQEEIDSQEAIFRGIKDQVGYSTISINLFEYRANLSTGSNSFGSKIKDAFAFSWNLIESLFLGVISLWPIWLLLLVGGTLLRRYRRNKKNKLNDR